MSVAFTKEEDYESVAANLPDRPVSTHPNMVTPKGLALIETALAQARAAMASAKSGGDVSADRTAMARATRDLRYWSARRGSAQLVEAGAVDGTLQFGGKATIEREDGRRQSWQIVGEDEADPAKGSVSWISPLGQALLGKTVGDEAVVAGQAVEIVAIG